MNLLIERLLAYSGFRWDPGTFAPMCEFFEAQPQASKDEFVAAARAMTNKAFEATVYWGIVSGHIVQRDKRCRFCALPRGLVVHHRTYEHRGLEHRYLDDLEALCFTCHTDRHARGSAADGLRRLNPDKTLDQILAERGKESHERRINAREHRRIRSPWE